MLGSLFLASIQALHLLEELTIIGYFFGTIMPHIRWSPIKCGQNVSQPILAGNHNKRFTQGMQGTLI